MREEFNALPRNLKPRPLHDDLGKKSTAELEAEITYWRDKCTTLETEVKGISLERDHYIREAKDAPEVKMTQKKMAAAIVELEK